MKNEIVYSYELPPAPVYANSRERHQAMIEQHREDKALRRERHRARAHDRSVPPNML